MKTKITVKPVLDTRRVLSKGGYPVKLRVTFNRINRLYSIPGLELGLTEAEFNQVRIGKPKGKLKEHGVEIENMVVKARTLVESLNDFTFDSFKEEWDGKKIVPKDLTLQGTFDWRVQRLKEQGRLGSADCAAFAFKSLAQFFGPQKNLTTIKPKDLSAYLDHMRRKGKSIATVGIYTRDLRRLYNELVEANMIAPEFYPFGMSEFRTPKARKSKTALKIEDIRKILSYKAEESTKEGFNIDLWLFSYLCSGMNMKDIASLKYSDLKENFLFFIREKTQSRNRTETKIKVPLIEATKSIIEKRGNSPNHLQSYIFPILKPGMTQESKRKQVQNVNNQINKCMKRLATSLNLSMRNVNCISARDAFATISSSQGRPLKDISESLGHSDISVTQHYLAQIQDEEKMDWQNKLV